MQHRKSNSEYQLNVRSPCKRTALNRRGSPVFYIWESSIPQKWKTLLQKDQLVPLRSPNGKFRDTLGFIQDWQNRLNARLNPYLSKTNAPTPRRLSPVETPRDNKMQQLPVIQQSKFLYESHAFTINGACKALTRREVGRR